MELELVKEFSFEAAHFLPNYPGKCWFVHGHSYRLLVGVRGEVGKNGMVCDFNTIKEVVEGRVISILDHQYLNTIKDYGFPWQNPTAENIVAWIVSRLRGASFGTAELSFVRLYETTNSYAEWRGSK